jgi:DNA-binding SARP family transcriptional activator
MSPTRCLVSAARDTIIVIAPTSAGAQWSRWGERIGGAWGPADVVPASGPGDGPDVVTHMRDAVSTRPSTIPGLDVTLLGRFAITTADGREIRLVGRHAQALFTLLVLTRRPRTREAIATDLWPESLGAATGPLRQALYQLRSALAAARLDIDAMLEADVETLGLRPEAIRSLDVARFETCTDDPSCAAEAAVALYHGDLAEGLGHDCFAAERERLADRYEDALAVVARRRLADGDEDGARLAAERLIARDPLREEAHEVLIAVHGLRGSRSQVVRQYRRLCDVLGRELAEVPLPETDATYRVALARTIARSRERAVALELPTAASLAAVS